MHTVGSYVTSEDFGPTGAHQAGLSIKQAKNSQRSKALPRREPTQRYQDVDLGVTIQPAEIALNPTARPTSTARNPTPLVAEVSDSFPAWNGESVVVDFKSNTISLSTASSTLNASAERFSAEQGSVRSQERTRPNGDSDASLAIDPQLDIYQPRQQLNAKRERSKHRLLKQFRPVKADPLLENYISDRNMTFIVENGTTMLEHWSEALCILETLTSN